jgi:hypothetical protein
MKIFTFALACLALTTSAYAQDQLKPEPATTTVSHGTTKECEKLHPGSRALQLSCDMSVQLKLLELCASYEKLAKRRGFALTEAFFVIDGVKMSCRGPSSPPPQ